jgi:hypothetical protein
MLRNRMAGSCIALLANLAWAQSPPNALDWVEDQATSPPSYSRDQLIPIDMPPYVSIKIGVDPATITMGADGVVRYVVVMRNASGSVNAAYEGIRCTTDEVKTYARSGSSGDWHMVEQPQWKAVNDNLPSRHAFAIARQGGCETRLSTSTAEVIRALKQRQKMGN